MSAFARRQGRWLDDAHRQTSAESRKTSAQDEARLQRRIDDAEAERGIEFRVETHRKKPKPPDPQLAATAVQRWEADRAERGILGVDVVAKLAALSLQQCWHIALTEDVELRGREVWSRPADNEDAPLKLDGTLAADITEDAFWTAVAEAYSK